MRILLRILTLAIMTLAACGAAAAENYPHMPVSIVTGLAPGSITDVIARYLSGKLEQLAGRTFIVINKVGANGIIAANEVVRIVMGRQFGLCLEPAPVQEPSI